MKKLTIILVLVMTTVLFAGENDMQTILYGDIESGGYGGPVVKFSNLNSNFGVLVGGRGGWIINSQFVLGGGGYGLVNDIEIETQSDTSKYLNFGYGGLELGYIFASNKLVHLDFNTLIGAGGVGYRHSVFDEEWEDCDCEDSFDEVTDPVFVLEPTLNLMVNITKNVRFGVGASYRYVAGVKNMVIEDKDLSGASASISLKFGAF